MLVIGLTGGIGSGKSTVAEMLHGKGARIIDADRLAREIVEPGQPALKEIVIEFGEEVVLADGSLDRKALGAKVFHNEAARKKLNEITHPYVINLTKELLEETEREGKHKVAVIDAPLLLEVGMQEMVDEVWLTALDEKIQLERVLQRDKLTPKEAKKRISSQMPLEEKKKYADRIIDTSGTIEETEAEINRLWQVIC